MKKFIIFLFIFSHEICFAENTVTKSYFVENSLSLNLSSLIKSSIEIIDLDIHYPYTNSYMWGGDEKNAPKRIIKKIRVEVNKENIFIPLSSYADLGDPKKFVLEKTSGDKFRLTISGGDAAGSYTAVFDFKKREILRRKVSSGEFPKNVWEETKFSFNNLKE